MYHKGCFEYFDLSNDPGDRTQGLVSLERMAQSWACTYMVFLEAVAAVVAAVVASAAFCVVSAVVRQPLLH